MTGRAVRVLAVAAACSVLWASAALGEGSGKTTGATVQIRHVDTSAFPNVTVTVAVPAQVASGAIQVTENGFPVKVLNARSLATAAGSIDIVLAVDTSDSVQGVPLATAVEAATSFIQQLPSGIGVGLMTFSDRARIVGPISTDHQAIVTALSGLSTTQSGTALYDGLATAAGMFSGAPQRNVVLLTDGADVGSKTNLALASALARRKHVTVFTVGLGTSVDTTVLQQIANGTEGSYTSASEADLLSIYQTLAGQISNQFVIQYRSHVPGGVQVTIGANVQGLGSDQTFVLTPRFSVPPAPESLLHRFLVGPWGMVAVLSLFFLLVFAISLVLAGSNVRARRDRELARRMSAPSDPGVPVRPDDDPASWIPEPLVAAGEAVAAVGGFDRTLERRLERAGIPMTPGEFVTVNVGVVVIGGLTGGLVFRTPFWVVVLVALTAVLPSLLLGRKMNKRLDLLHRQLPDVLMILASSMRAGHSFLQALDTVSKEVGEPSSLEFARVVTEIRLGRSPDEALTAMGERVGTEEFKWAMMAVNVQREVGGNLAEVLDTLAQTVREREAVRRQIRVLSAEGRLSMWLLALIPPALTLYIIKVNPAYMRLLWTTRLGWIFIAIAVILMSTGFFIARKIVKIDV